VHLILNNPVFSNHLWRPVLVVKEAGIPGENYRPWASNWSTLSLAVNHPIAVNITNKCGAPYKEWFT
jgi:hypothetical protein